VLKEKQICSFGKAFLSEKRFIVKICVIWGLEIKELNRYKRDKHDNG